MFALHCGCSRHTDNSLAHFTIGNVSKNVVHITKKHPESVSKGERRGEKTDFKSIRERPHLLKGLHFKRVIFYLSCEYWGKKRKKGKKTSFLQLSVLYLFSFSLIPPPYDHIKGTRVFPTRLCNCTFFFYLCVPCRRQ